MSEEATPEQAVETKPEKPAKKGKVKKERVKKKGKGKVLVILSLVILLLGGGGFAAAAFMGLIPGLKLGGKPVAKNNPEADSKNKEASNTTAPPAETAKTPPTKPIREAIPEPETPKKRVPVITIDPDKGAKSIARIWEKMEPEKLAEIAATYKDLELARVLRGMETKKAAALLGLLPADRAGKLSQEMEKLASRVVPTPGT